MKSIKSPILWCTLLGMVVGYFGVPVFIREYDMWVWNQPYGFHIASILILGSVGCLVGLFLHLWISKRVGRAGAMWTTAAFSFVLVCGTVGFYRYHAHEETAMWTDVNLGFVRAMGVAQQNPTNTNKGIQLLQAGADVQAGVNIGGIERFGRNRYQKLSSIARAFSEAGYFMVSQADKEKLQESIQFVNQAGPIIRQMGNQSYPRQTNHLDEIISKITSCIPNDFDTTWPAN